MGERHPRNHAARVGALQRLERAGLLTFVESRRPDDGRWLYVVRVTGDGAERAVPTSQIDTFLTVFGLALAACAGRGHPDNNIGGGS
jgi:hypothetical protein